MLSSADGIKGIGEAFTAAKLLRSKAEAGAKLTMQRIGIIGLIFTGNDLVGAWQDCR